MESTESQRCRWCGDPVKRGRACGSHADLERAYRQLHGDDDAPPEPVAGLADSRNDDPPNDPPGGAA